ncbi:S8 family peptidase [Oceanobacillus salinisoli]|uniref:S8 family peptidase n=1 Tax=Oceanobacillus salinisoli TaxID=2678611 RepID=UPI0012E23444|nr:S8 family peptidase [Oceanobacillus salinisoli]
MSKRNYISLLVLSTILVGIYQPIYAMDRNDVEVIIGYENEDGKQSILEHSSEVEYQFQHLSAMSVLIDKNRASELYDNPNISYIIENQVMELSVGDQITEVPVMEDVHETEHWNIDLIGTEKAWLEGATGKGVKIAIIDTGISPHSELTIEDGISTVEYTDEWMDDNGHGTHVAGVIAGKRDDHGVVGVAPDASLYAVKALDENGEGNLDDVLEAIDWAIENEMDMINLSLGTEVESPLLEEIVNKAYETGILIVGASGNSSNTNSVMYPAKYESVIGVSAVDARLKLASFSSTGREVEFSGPGLNIFSTYLNNSYGIANGTSQAAPHVTGMLALLKEKHPEMSHVELREELVQHVQDSDEKESTSSGHVPSTERNRLSMDDADERKIVEKAQEEETSNKTINSELEKDASSNEEKSSDTENNTEETGQDKNFFENMIDFIGKVIVSIFTWIGGLFR